MVAHPHAAYSETYNTLRGLTQNKEGTGEFAGYLCPRG